jgi:hypothetical protein
MMTAAENATFNSLAPSVDRAGHFGACIRLGMRASKPGAAEKR